MIGRIVQLLTGGPHSEDEERDGASAFAGSLLDWSVNYGHGPDGGRGEAAREMAEIQAQAELLDEQDHHRR
jgi:hypothetical protein